MGRYKLIALTLLLLLLLAGCNSADEAPVKQEVTEPSEAVAGQAAQDEEPAPAAVDTVTPQPAEPTETPGGQAEGAATQEAQVAQPAPAEPQPTPEPPPATTEPQFNGEYEETFYRGLATAPITMIDFSDLL